MLVPKRYEEWGKGESYIICTLRILRKGEIGGDVTYREK
jgi:hypothetical protein